MAHKLHRPFVVHLVEKPPNVRVQNPVHFLPLQARIQRIQRLMRTPPRAKPVAEPPKVHLIYFIENGHHSLLDDLILQRCNANRTLPSVGLRDIDSSTRLRPVRAPVNPVF